MTSLVILNDEEAGFYRELNGRGIVSITRTSGDGSAGSVDTYTIRYTDSTSSTFEVRNGPTENGMINAYAARLLEVEAQIRSIAANFNFRVWAPGQTYGPGEAGSLTARRDAVLMSRDGVAAPSWHVATVLHVSGLSFTADAAAGKWADTEVLQLRGDLADTGTGKGADMISYQRSGLNTLLRSVYDFLEDVVLLTSFATLEAAALSGKRVFCPPGTYTHGRLTIGNGTEFFGPRSAIFQINAVDTAHFFSNNIGWFSIFGVTIRGLLASTGATATDPINRCAVSVYNTTDFQVENCLFEQHAGGGVGVNNTSIAGAGVQRGAVRNNIFIKGDTSGMGHMTTDPVPVFVLNGYGVQDNAPVQIYQFAKNIEVSGNISYGSWYLGVLVQDTVNDGASAVTGINVRDNKFFDLKNYGIVSYCGRASAVDYGVASISDNGSGLFRVVTRHNHKYSSGAVIHLSFAGTASGIWRITVVNATTFDLQGSTFAAGAIANDDTALRLSNNCSGHFSDNIIDGVEGSREFAPGNKPYGAGFYAVGVGGITLKGNTFRRTNQQTNSDTLTPASIGIASATGQILAEGNVIEDYGYQGISIKQADAYGLITVRGGQIVRGVGRAISMNSPSEATIDGVEIDPQGLGEGTVFSSGAATDVTVKNVKLVSNGTATYFMQLFNMTGFAVRGNYVMNRRPAGATFEGLRITSSSDGLVDGNNIDGNASAHPALVINAVTNTQIAGNRFRMTSDGAARSTVWITGVCTGTVYTNDNNHYGGRMENTSTGGAMHTREANANSGGKTRQAGDTITNTNPGVGGVAVWVKTAASAGGTNWQGLTLS